MKIPAAGLMALTMAGCTLESIPLECPGAVELTYEHNDSNAKRINVIFVSVNYRREDVLNKVEDAFKNDFLKVPIFGSNYDSFNFYYYPEPLWAPIYDQKDFGAEAERLVSFFTSPCSLPNKFTVALVNWDFTSNAEWSPVRYIDLPKLNLENIAHYQEKYARLNQEMCKGYVSDWCPNDEELCQDISKLRGLQSPTLDEQLCSIIAGGGVNLGTVLISENGYPYVVSHESGHGILGLRDEYINLERVKDQDSYLQELIEIPINCYAARTHKECVQNSPWAEMIGTKEGIGCYKGCAYLEKTNDISFWRSFENGLMNNHSVAEMGAWNEYVGCLALHVVTQKAKGVCDEYNF